MKLFKHNGPAIGIDLGTTNILVYVKNKGLVVKEPSLLAVDAKTKKIVAVGQKAKKMQGRTHAGIKIIQPIRDGGITDFTAATELIQYYVKNLSSKGVANRKPLVIITTPTHYPFNKCGTTGSQRCGSTSWSERGPNCRRNFCCCYWGWTPCMGTNWLDDC